MANAGSVGSSWLASIATWRDSASLTNLVGRRPGVEGEAGEHAGRHGQSGDQRQELLGPPGAPPGAASPRPSSRAWLASRKSRS